MSPFQRGGKIWCLPVKVLAPNTQVFVRVAGIDKQIPISLKELFPKASEENCSFFAGSVVCREPHDVVTVDRPFVAKIVADKPIALSRRERIADLWRELEDLARHKGFALATLTGQNRDFYYLSIEGNIRFRTPKSPLENYLAEYLTSDAVWHKYAPAEGDTLACQIANVFRSQVKLENEAPGVVEVDLVEPLRRLNNGKLDEALSHLFGARRVGSPNDYVGGNTLPDAHPPTPRQYGIDRSDDLTRRRGQTRVIVVDDNVSFRELLAWLLCEIGYPAESLAPEQVDVALLSKAQSDTILLIDADMPPRNGISLIRDLTTAIGASPWPKCLLMSALALDEPMESAGGVTLGEAAQQVSDACLFWHNCDGRLEESIVALDDIILHYDLYRGDAGQSFRIAPQPRTTEAPAARPLLLERLDDLEQVVADVREKTEARWAALFQMDRTQWKVRVLAGEQFLKDRSEETGAQSYLPNSPIRDISYQPSPHLLDDNVAADLPRFKNLQRFFRTDIHEPTLSTQFGSVAAVRLNIGTAKRYSLFVFHPRAQAFTREHTLPLLTQAAERAELVILRTLHAAEARTKQALYLVGLARAGLWHDAPKQVTNIESFATKARSLLHSGGEGVEELLVRIETTAGEVKDRINMSLERLQPHMKPVPFEVREVVDYAVDIARGVARRVPLEIAPTVTKAYPEDRFLVEGEPNALQRVLENLLVNSVEHGTSFAETGIRATIEVRVELQPVDDPAYPVAILVHDNGPGIHGFDRPSIFDPLFSTKEDGFGMGLAIVRTIGEDHGIQAEVLESATLTGTTFVVRVPRKMAYQYRGVEL